MVFKFCWPFWHSFDCALSTKIAYIHDVIILTSCTHIVCLHLSLSLLWV